MKIAIDILSQEISIRRVVLKDKEWGTHIDGLNEENRTHRQILNAELQQLYLAKRKLIKPKETE